VDWARDAEMPLHVLLTKADKLKRGPAKATMLKVKKELKDMGDLVSVQMYSSLKEDGVKELRKRLTTWFLDNTEFVDDEEGEAPAED